MDATKKQKDFIRSISDVLLIDLSNKEIESMTKGEASDFISRHVDDFYKEVEFDQILTDIQNENAGDR